MSGDPAANPALVGVRQPAFDTMVNRHARAAAQVDELARALWTELKNVQLDTSPAIRLREMASRLREQASDLQRRQRLVHEMERQKIDFGFRTDKGTFWELPDRLNALQARVDGAAAADLARKAAAGDRAALSRLTKFASEAADPAFAKSLLEKLGADGIITLPAALAQRLRLDMDGRDSALGADEAAIQSTLKMLGKALAVGTDPGGGGYVGDPYLERLKAQGRADHRFPVGGPNDTYTGYQSLATLLGTNDGHPPFSPHFMRVVGRDMIAYDREHRPRNPLPRTPSAVVFPYVPGMPRRRPEDGSAPMPDLAGLLQLGWALTPTGNRATVQPPSKGRTDFLNGLLHAAGFSKEGSQALLDHTPSGQKNSDLEYLLHERRPLWAYTDHGTTLGQTMKAAMSGHDATSQRLFKEMSELLGRDTRRYFGYGKDHRLKFDNVDGHADDLSGLRPSLGEIMRSHLGEIAVSISADALLGADGKAPGPTRQNIDALLAEVSQDDQVFSSLIWDEIARTHALLDQQYADRRGVDNVLISQGTLIGHLLAMRREALMARGETTDAANRQIKDFVNKGIGLVPIPYVNLFGGVSKAVYSEVVKSRYSEVGNWLSQLAQQDGGSSDQDAKTASDEQTATALLRQMSLSVAVEHANASGIPIRGEPFAENGRILSVDQWIGDPKKVDKFVRWCDRNDFAAPRMGQNLKSTIENSHDDAVSSFASARTVELRP
jgi:hypothetical protein